MFCISLLFPLLALCNGFSVNPSSIDTSLVGQGGHLGFPSSSNGFALFMSSEDDNVTPKRRRRRKKVGITDDSNEDIQEVETTEDASGNDEIAEESVDLELRARAPVTLEVQDVRGLVGGVPSVKAAPTTTTMTAESKSAPTPTTSDQSLEVPADRTVPDDSFAQLLEDARRMSEDSEDSGDNGDGDESIKVKARNILSTIVTADFFVVFGFLLWFLAGIGFRAVFNDDSVQIAFNSKILC